MIYSTLQSDALCDHPTFSYVPGAVAHLLAAVCLELVPYLLLTYGVRVWLMQMQASSYAKGAYLGSLAVQPIHSIGV